MKGVNRNIGIFTGVLTRMTQTGSSDWLRGAISHLRYLHVRARAGTTISVVLPPPLAPQENKKQLS